MRRFPLFIAALAAGSASAFAFQPVGWWPLMILAIAILCELIARAGSLRRALLVGWLFGLGQFAIGLNWIATAFTFQAKMPASLGWLAVLLLSLYLAIYPAMAAGLAWRFGERNRLALVLALFKASPEMAWMTVGGGLVYAIVLLTVGRKLLQGFGRAFERSGRLTMDVFTSVIVCLMICAFITDYIGIYAVFGAFIFGAAMPKGKLADALTERIEQLTTSLFLPMFFVYSGLNTKIGLLNTVELWAVAGVVVLASILGNALWNRMSRLLPLTLVGQMILFETLFALIYGSVWEQRWPTVFEALAFILICCGVVSCISVHKRDGGGVH